MKILKFVFGPCVLVTEQINLTVTTSTNGFASVNKLIVFDWTCEKCGNITIKDPENELMAVPSSYFGSAAQLVLTVNEHLKLGNYTWYSDKNTVIYSLLYRICNFFPVTILPLYYFTTNEVVVF